jgi:glycosyltransferase involved in cell wall biosynthesis
VGDDLSGVGVYSRNLLLALSTAHPETRIDCYYRPHRLLRACSEPLPPNARRRALVEPFSFGVPPLFHGLNQRLPEMRLKRSVATFHDLFVLTGDYSTAEFRVRFAAQARAAAARADAIIAVSAFTASQVIDLLKVDPAKVSVVHHGVRELAYPPVAREKVILNVGAIQVRKNVERIVEAFEAVEGEWRLVLAGSSGYGADRILRRIESSRKRDRITVAGYVTPDELAAWYARASVFVFPSLDEGFGMPVLEAMAAGVPVITSNRSALPEVAGDAAISVNPDDTGELTGALRSLTEDEGLRQAWVEKGKVRLANFSWERAASQTWDIYRRTLA